jgi:hypothetical protein
VWFWGFLYPHIALIWLSVGKISTKEKKTKEKEKKKSKGILLWIFK